MMMMKRLTPTLLWDNKGCHVMVRLWIVEQILGSLIQGVNGYRGKNNLFLLLYSMNTKYFCDPWSPKCMGISLPLNNPSANSWVFSLQFTLILSTLRWCHITLARGPQDSSKLDSSHRLWPILITSYKLGVTETLSLGLINLLQWLTES